MTLLAIDCSASLCAACVYDAVDGHELGRSVLDLGKGHAEHLIAVIDEALWSAGKTYAELTAIAVSIGPGSFTGIRVAVSAARGFALALDIPAIGVNTLEALAAEVREAGGAKPVMAALISGQESVQFAVYDEFGSVAYPPGMIAVRVAAELASSTKAVLAGTAARHISELSGQPVACEKATADIGVYARVALAKGADGGKPSPLYLREPDAKPQAGFILPRRQS
jgi:tRNA threonylcarbamoyladenosine biosynthesis protein TsaB